MIQSNEFRIGNYLHDSKGRLCKVEELHFKEGFSAPAIMGGLTSLPNKPIPITKEWFIKFWFELYPWGWVKKSSKDFGLRITINNYYEISGNKSIKIKYVHELQNLYFALTGEELILTK